MSCPKSTCPLEQCSKPLLVEYYSGLCFPSYIGRDPSKNQPVFHGMREGFCFHCSYDFHVMSLLFPYEIPIFPNDFHFAHLRAICLRWNCANPTRAVQMGHRIKKAGPQSQTASKSYLHHQRINRFPMLFLLILKHPYAP